jgi:hypothetical protein
MAIPYPDYKPPLIISFKKQGKARMNKSDQDLASSDADFSEVKPEVRKRDKYSCQYCGTRATPESEKSGGGVEVHHISGDHSDNRWTNLLTVCPLCHAILHFMHSTSAKDMLPQPGEDPAKYAADVTERRAIRDSMRLLYLPWISQENLNLLSWGMAIAKYRSGKITEDKLTKEELEIRDAADELANTLVLQGRIPDDFFPREHATEAEQLGCAENLAKALIEVGKKLPIKEDAVRENLLTGLRVFFHPEKLATVSVVTRFSDAKPWMGGTNWAQDWRQAVDGRRGAA